MCRATSLDTINSTSNDDFYQSLIFHEKMGNIVSLQDLDTMLPGLRNAVLDPLCESIRNFDTIGFRYELVMFWPPDVFPCSAYAKQHIINTHKRFEHEINHFKTMANQLGCHLRYLANELRDRYSSS